jgi:hypothetical protein
MSKLSLSTSAASVLEDLTQGFHDAAADYELEALAELALNADLRAKNAATEAKSANDAFRKALIASGKLNADTHAVGPVRTVIYPTKRWNEALARTLMTKKLQKECEKTVLDSAAVKAKVSPEVYETMQEVSGWTLKLSVDSGK